MGVRLARLRQLRGWSQVQLARRAGLTAHGISQIESGRRDGWGMELETAWRLAWALGTSIDMLAGIPELRG
jgi:transcriptional regulator with XRE-family HTH domain